MTRSRLLGAFVGLALLTACSDNGSSATPTTTAGTATTAADTTPGTEATATTVSAADEALAYSEPGPYPVGVTTLQLEKGPLVEVWYPAVAGTTGSETYDVRDYVPEAIRQMLTADIPAGTTYAAGRDAAVADGAFPVVLFSHGFTGIRVQSTFLTANMASYGLIVVSPEHPSRDLTNVLGLTASGDREDSVDDLLQSLDLITAAGDDAASPFHGHVDAEHVAAVGHSAGGGTVLGAAADERIDGYVSLASGVLRGRSADGSTTTTIAYDMPDKPSLFVAGSLDGIVSADEVTRPAYAAAPSPSTLWIIDGVGHNGFDDFCTFGDGSGIIGLADASGLSALLETFPTLRKLGEDGCKPPALAVTTTFPIIRHVVTAWVLALFGIDAKPVGLGAEVADQYTTPVEIDSK
jgi:dienelactone hydrolase